MVKSDFLSDYLSAMQFYTAPVNHSTDIHTVITTDPNILRIYIETVCTDYMQAVQEVVHTSYLYIRFE